MLQRCAAWCLVAGLIACGDSPASPEPEPEPDPAAPTSAQSPVGANPAPPGGSAGVSAPATMRTPAGTPPSTTPMSGGSAGSSDPTAPPPSAMEPVDPTSQDPPPPDEAVDVMGGRIYWLDIVGNGVYSALADGSQMKRIASALAAPDGVAVDDCTGHIYFSNMGSALGNSGQASVQRARWDGSGVETLIKPGSGVNTAKQLTLDQTHGHIYFADREGAKVWRSALDGSGLTAVVSGHDFSQLVGVAVEPADQHGAGHLYFTDRNRGLVLRTGLELPAGQTAENRQDIETLVKSPSGAMPIDLALDLSARTLYWTDRALGLVQRVGLELPAGEDPGDRSDQKVVVDGLSDPIGISLDLGTSRMYVTVAGGAVFRLGLDGSSQQMIAKTSSGTGIAFALIGPDGAHRQCK
jgi:sugar lactone lactonase YvrE